ncbi:MAG: hypothetical protein GQ570_03720 [Helicobacteraceae bacterium]|nr:hypothetical protein [Helicobacteraceae bacterium]
MTTIDLYIFSVVTLYLVFYIMFTWVEPYTKYDRDKVLMLGFLFCVIYPLVLVIAGLALLTERGLFNIFTKERKWFWEKD